MHAKIDVAVIGLGNMGRHHARNYSSLAQANLVAVCDPNQERVDRISQEYGCSGYTSIEEMLCAHSIQAASIASPTCTHMDIAQMLISKRIHVLIEKPITDSVESAKALLQLAQQHGVKVMVGHIERFNPALIALKKYVDSGQLGEIVSLLSRRVGVFPNQIKDANVVLDVAVHDIDIFSFLINRQPDHVFGNAGSALIQSREDYAEMLLTYGRKNGVIQVNWITPVRIRNLVVTGTQAYAELDYMTQALTVYKSNWEEEIDISGEKSIIFNEPKKVSIPVQQKEPLAEELGCFLQAILTDTAPPVTGEDGLNALQTALHAMDVIQNKVPQ